MHRKFSQTIYALSLCCLVTIAAEAQLARTDSSEVLRQLLFLPAPPPVLPEAKKTSGEERRRPREFYGDANAPADDAPLEDLIAYWESKTSPVSRSSPAPTLEVRQRLFAVAEAEPERLPRLLHVIPRTEEVAERVKNLYDEAQNSAQFKEDWQESVREWLKFNSKYFLSDLLALTRKVKEKEGYVDNQEALTALAKVDWPSAEPLLHTLAESGAWRTSALALVLLYRHALEAKDTKTEEKLRARLKAIAIDGNAPARARDLAIEELSLTEWAGRDEWYLSLLADETLLQPSDGSFGFSPLTTLFNRDPDKWIPLMAKLVESKSSAVRQSAASCLVLYAIDHPRRDAILPVLRWLSDPDWLPISSTYRAWFMQKMDELDMPESVPGLIWIVENEEIHRGWAARTLAHYKDPRAIPALRKALAQESDESSRHLIIEGLMASGGVSETEQIAALEAYAGKLTTSEGRQEMERYRLSDEEEALPVPLSIGMFLAQRKEPPAELVQAVLSRVEYLQKKNPELARALLEVTQGWEARQLDLDMLRRVAAGTADAAMIAKLLERRERVRARVRSELQSLVAEGGAAQGIAIALLADESLLQSALGANDNVAQMALLACARLVQMPLPVEQVGALLQSKNPNLALAAERYLLAEDSPAARRLLWARHENEAFITGWRENISLIGGNNFEAIGRAEEKLRAELFKEDAPLEILALLGNKDEPLRVVRLYRDRAVYTNHEDDARYSERVITKEELAQFRNFITTSNLPELGPQISYCHHDCSVSEFLSLTKKSGRRVFSHQGLGGWIMLYANFDILGKGDGVKIHYRLENEIKGLEILLADKSLSVRDVWQKGSDLRVFVEREETFENIRQQSAAAEDSEEEEEDPEAARARLRREQTERQRARFSWRSVTNGRPGAPVSQPKGYSTFDESAFGFEAEDVSLDERGAFDAAAGKVIVFAGSFSKGGLWKKTIGQNVLAISEEGKYANVFVTPDGKWVVAAKADEDWAAPNYVVRVNLQTNREYRVKLPAADEFAPVAYIRAHGKMLLRRARADGDDDPKSLSPLKPEYYLLDAATGQTQLVTGVFAPLLEEGKRFFQPAGKPSEFWAAIPDYASQQTRVGRYNIRDFSFQTLMVVPHLIFNSTTMWVDEGAAKLYVVYEGQLLRLPLRITP